MPARILRIYGQVQGVFFRARAAEEAESIGVFGWVRNFDDGSVEVFAEGSQEQLEKFERWCRRGPPRARVERVVSVDAEGEDLSDFKVR